MNYIKRDRLWWEEIPGPRSILNEILEALKGARSVILNSYSVPWIESVRFFIARELQDQHIIATEIDASTQGEMEPGRFLLEQMGQRNDINNFRYGIPIHRYLKDRNILQKKLVCVSNIEPSKCKTWTDFISQHKPRNMQEGIFLLEVCNPDSGDGGLTPTRILRIDISSKLSIYDVLSFAMLMTSSLSVHDTWKQYIGWLAAIVFEANLEGLVDFFDKELQNLDITKIIAFMENHVKDKKYFDHSAWRSQMHIFFPIIEQLRISFIEQHIDVIRSALQENEIIYCQRRIIDPYDTELGPLAYITGQDMIHISGKECAEILFLHDCRNILAHVNPCEPARMERIINIAQQRKMEI